MKTKFLFIDESLNSKNNFLCFLILLLGIFLCSYSYDIEKNNFFLNVYHIMTNYIFLISLILAFLINNINIVNELIARDTFNLRVSKAKQNSFYKKELILSNLYLFLISLILIIAFSVFFSKNNYSFLISLNGIKLWVLDFCMLLIFLMLSIISGLMFQYLLNFFNKDVACIVYLIFNCIFIFFYFSLSFNIYNLLMEFIFLLLIWLISTIIERTVK